jgi:hypothetical protein
MQTRNGDCSTSQTACSLQECYGYAVEDVDPSGYSIVCQLSNGLYKAGLIATQSLLNGSEFTLSGNPSSPAGVVIDPGNGANAIVASGHGVNLIVENLQLGGALQSTGTNDAIMAGSGAVVTVTNIIYGYVNGTHNESFQFGEIAIYPPYMISGGGLTHWHVYESGLIVTNSGTITCSGSPAFSGFFGGVQQSQLVVVSPTFSGCGSVTGPKFLAHQLGIIFTGGQSTDYFPGSQPGFIDNTTFGLYQ